MKKYLFIILLVGVCYSEQNLIYISAKDGSVFKSPNIGQITDSSITLISHNITLPLQLISKVSLKDLNNSYSFISESCLGVILGLGVTYIVSPKFESDMAELEGLFNTASFIANSFYVVPITFILYHIARQQSKIETIDMNDWSNDGKMKFFKQYQIINNL